MSDEITGKTLIDLGYTPGPWFAEAIKDAEYARRMGGKWKDVIAAVDAHKPPPQMPLQDGVISYWINIEADPNDPDEVKNVADVKAHMDELMRVPTVVNGAVMPDACPSDRKPGTIPVGGVVSTKNAIHPGMHSADICCSVAVSIFPADTNPTYLLDSGMIYSHFGGGGRPRGQQMTPPGDIMARFEANPLLAPLSSMAIEHFATQGDGNHFYYVGRVESTGEIALVTHHGSRGPGAKLYKSGMAIAEKTRRKLSPETAPHNAWIVADSADGELYWLALQTIRAWTKASHFQIHDLVAAALQLKVKDRFWNEHNFVFSKPDGLFYHAKGATPSYPGFAADDGGLTLIPLNMAEPILVTGHMDAAHGLGFAPHGAGRNFSRTQYLSRHAGRTAEEMIAEQAPGIDVRYFSGHPDLSELPGAYKNAATVQAQINKFALANVVERIMPIGSIMAGDWQKDAPWRKGKGRR